MKISSICFNFKPERCTQSVVTNMQSVNFKANTSTDYVTFNSNKEIYRAVTSEEEIDALICGEAGGFYATANPNGWRGDFPGRYFITFKTNFLSSDKVEYDETDKKYRLRHFTFDDIANIREGNTIKGKIIYDS